MKEATRALPDLKRVKNFRATCARLYSAALQPLWPDHSITTSNGPASYATKRILKKSKKYNKKDSQGCSTKWKYCMMLGCGSYRGWLGVHTFGSGKIDCNFYDNNETTEVTFSDKDVQHF